MLDAHFISEVIALALDIASRQRNEDHMLPAKVLRSKFFVECRELAEASNIWDEIPDVMYYATCLVAYGQNYCLGVLKKEILPQYGITIGQAKKACLAKYRLRAAGEPKNIEKERAAVMAAI